MKKLLSLLASLVIGITLQANNLNITGIVVNQITQNITFSLSWENSWSVTGVPNNWDAVWVFVKWKVCSDGTGVAFSHGALSPTTAHHTYTNLEAMTSVDGVVTQSAVQGATLDYTTGIMLRRSAIGLGTTTSSVSLRVINLPAAGIDISVNVYGTEMVYVPQGDFYVGDGNGTNTSNASFLNTNVAGAVPTTSSAPPMLITSAFETAQQTFFTNTVATPPNYVVQSAWPKGQYGFYIMKYEISQGHYAEFLNALSTSGATARYPGSFNTNRNQLTQINGIYSSIKSDRAQNFLSWTDISAFLDWSCLRPMTETEYEKACRGNSGVSAYLEYAWGNTTITTGLTFVAPGVENGTELLTTGNAIYGSGTYLNGDLATGPVRTGIFATSTSTRVIAGASFYGVMELSGNVRELVIAMGNATTVNLFTRTWGDGAIDLSANHNVLGGWPVWNVLVSVGSHTNTLGYRGGSWIDGASNAAVSRLNVSDRESIFTTTNITRMNNNGGRGVR